MTLTPDELRRAASLTVAALIAEAATMGPTVRDALADVVRAALARRG